MLRNSSKFFRESVCELRVPSVELSKLIMGQWGGGRKLVFICKVWSKEPGNGHLIPRVPERV